MAAQRLASAAREVVYRSKGIAVARPLHADVGLGATTDRPARVHPMPRGQRRRWIGRTSSG